MSDGASSDLPAEQPSRYYFGINLRTATALGLTISQSLLIAQTMSSGSAH